jgi:hypothetical protein
VKRPNKENADQPAWPTSLLGDPDMEYYRTATGELAVVPNREFFSAPGSRKHLVPSIRGSVRFLLSQIRFLGLKGDEEVVVTAVLHYASRTPATSGDFACLLAEWLHQVSLSTHFVALCLDVVYQVLKPIADGIVTQWFPFARVENACDEFDKHGAVVQEVGQIVLAEIEWDELRSSAAPINEVEH